jgi:microcystin-dependent protein
MGANYSVIKTWADGETLTAADLNAEFQNTITNFTPAGMDDESVNITAMQATKDPYSGGTAVLPTSLQEEIQELRYMIQQITGKTYWYIDADSALCPTGSIILWTTDTAPTGFLLCSGQAVNRTTYAALFAIIGTTYGVGDNSTTFNVPDLRGRFPLGKDNMGGSSANRVTDADADTLGGADGDETKDLSHTHANGTLSHVHGLGETSVLDGSGLSDGSSSSYKIPRYSGDRTTAALASPSGATASGGSSTQDIMPPFITLNYVIKT